MLYVKELFALKSQRVDYSLNIGFYKDCFSHHIGKCTTFAHRLNSTNTAAYFVGSAMVSGYISLQNLYQTSRVSVFFSDFFLIAGFFFFAFNEYVTSKMGFIGTKIS